VSLQERKPVPRAREPRLLAHPFEVSTAGLFITSAINLGQAKAQGAEQSAGLLAMPSLLVWAWVLSLAIGGVLVIAGVLAGTSRAVGRGLETAGLYLAASAWTTLGVALIGPADLLGWLPVFIVAAGCVLRLIALARLNRVALKVAEVRRDGGAP
jgi:hypothetical protein